MRAHRVFIPGLALAAAALALAACGGATAQPNPLPIAPGDAARGKTAFTTCAACHGPDARGLPGLGKDLTASEYVRNSSDAELVAFIKVGRPVSDPLNTTGIAMPPKGGNSALNDQDLADIVAYIRTLQE